MKKYYFHAAFLFCLSFALLSTTACSRKTGCPANQEAHVKPNRKGQLPTSGGSSNLFDKKMRKRMKSGNRR